METLIGILLFIGAISPNSEYTVSEIELIEQENLYQIQQVEGDSDAMASANALYHQHSPTILIIDEIVL
ncbi:MAG: hypothetical protein KDC92_09625 [Bacteroidetes bacterium]|nr:hypothetical protein [Bacteroidota bacterium]